MKYNEEKMLKLGNLWEKGDKKRIYFKAKDFIEVTEDNGIYDRTINNIKVNDKCVRRGDCRVIDEMLFSNHSSSLKIYYDYSNDALYYSKMYSDVANKIIDSIINNLKFKISNDTKKEDNQ